MSTNSIEILESYIKGKDCDEYLILEQIYSEDAQVVFENASNTISFPEKIQGNKEIARVLSKDFNQNYKRVKTYYFSKPSNDQGNVLNQNWLVVMRDVNTDNTRIGSGSYDWEFAKTDGILKIQRHKIYIHSMLELADDNMEELSRVQNELSYPWADMNHACEILKVNDELLDISNYLNAIVSAGK